MGPNGERGQTATEYLGLLLVVCVLIGAVLASGVGPSVADGMRDALCRITGGACTAGRAGPGAPGSPPTGPSKPPPDPAIARAALTDRLIRGSLDDFLAYRSGDDHDPELDLSTDGCSAPLVGNTGASFDFTNACLRHDFGYRNTKKQGRFGDRKAEIDRRFLQDMKDHCATRSVFLQGRCYAWAYTFYEAVKRFG